MNWAVKSLIIKLITLMCQVQMNATWTHLIVNQGCVHVAGITGLVLDQRMPLRIQSLMIMSSCSRSADFCSIAPV